MDLPKFYSLGVAFTFAILNESIIEYMFGSVLRLKFYIPLLSLATGILLAFIYQINFVSLALGVETESPFLDFLFSGFIIARLSNLLNDLFQKFLGSK